jgi:branched-chain amino acid transport system ATP-binding protein
MLSVHEICVGYKELLAIHEVSFEVRKGEVVSLVGSNGAGKSTVIKTIAGLLHPKKGEIYFNKEPIHNTPPYEIVKK